MPGRASWDGKWSGEDKNYTIVRDLSGEDVACLFDSAPEPVRADQARPPLKAPVDVLRCKRSWTHRWSDGWTAEVTARVVPDHETLRKSDGFNGYEWMVDNILKTGSPYSEVTS